MAAANCDACCMPIVGPQSVQCCFCTRHYHTTCFQATAGPPTDPQLNWGPICNFGCRQAYEAGGARKKRSRARHECGACRKTFSNSSNLHAHQRQLGHGRAPVRFGPCPCCDPPVFTTTEQSLQMHLKEQKAKAQHSLRALMEEDAEDDVDFLAAYCGITSQEPTAAGDAYKST